MFLTLTKIIFIFFPKSFQECTKGVKFGLYSFPMEFLLNIIYGYHIYTINIFVNDNNLFS